ncbi:MAG: LysM peptidoglycan-binding domain-containing protein [Chloroflexi bacterium]|nr:LysM peptidoglycan-binding domain-containing protein [Chloroflexota bacterium]
MRQSRVFVAALSILVLLALLIAPLTAGAAPLATPGGSGCAQFYQVRPGDTLYRIALRFGTTVSALSSLNGIGNPNRIYAGQTLCVKAGAPIPFGFLYTVKWGDTLYSIGLRYGWSVAYLAQVNHLGNPNFIFAGQVLLIPYH